MDYCVQCGAEVSGARFCSRCGTRVGPGYAAGSGNPEAGDIAGLTKHQLGAVAYLTPIPAVLILLTGPFRGSRFLRFHAYQCLLLSLVAILVSGLTGMVALFGTVGRLMATILNLLLAVAWLAAALAAFRGHQLHLPFIGTVADTQARRR